jgi:hypothetical protein
MNFMEFNRRLEQCHVDKHTRYLLGYLYEVNAELNRNMAEATKALFALTEVVQNYTNINNQLLDDVKRLSRGNMPDGVEVHSVRNEPEE